MKFIKVFLIIVIFNLLNINTGFTQNVDISQIKYQFLNTKYYNLFYPKVIELIQNYKNDEVEILTLEMKKIGNTERYIIDGKIYFGEYGYNGIENRINNYTGQLMNEKDLFFSKIISPKINDKFKNYYTITLFVDKDILYNTILELGNNENFKLISSKTINGGVKKTFEFNSINKKIGFIIQTLDGDKISRISFLLNY